MGTSETYIKMCEKATEIQTNHEYVEGDIVAYLRSRNYQNFRWASEGEPQVELYIDGHIFDDVKIEFCWLPRQDQLQEMIGGYKEQKELITGYGYNESEYNGFLGLSCTHYWDKFASMEQLWLAFVMKEKYNKVWNGEDWKEN